MNDSIFENKRTDKKFNALAKQAVKQQKMAKAFMSETSPETLREIFTIIERNGHPYEQQAVRELRTKYEGNKNLDFNDILTLRDFYKSVYNNLKNKDEDNG